ncbi:MAG: hypothetical protein R3B09_08915 [Nannocystaceae bacterium]
METLTELVRRKPQALQIHFERRGLRGGPFVGVDDPAGLLVLPQGPGVKGRTFAGADQRIGELTLRGGVIADERLRALLRTHTFCGTPEYLDVWVILGDALVGRWHLDDAEIVEVADRRRVRDAASVYESLTLRGRLRELSVGR